MALTQLELDKQASTRGLARFRKTLINSMKSEDNVDSGSGASVIRHFSKTIATEIKAWQEHVTKYGSNNLAAYYDQLTALPSEISSYISLVYILGNVHKQPSKNTLAIGLGSRINDEVIYRKFRKERREEFNSIERLANKRIGFVYRRSCFNHYLVENNLFLEDRWDSKTQASVGTVILEIILNKTDILSTRQESRRAGKGLRQVIIVEASNELANWIQKYNTRHEKMCPFFEPRVDVAPDWNELFVSFKGSELPSIPFIKENRAVKLNQSANSDLSNVYKAVNILQHTSWIVNREVLDVAQSVFNNNWIVSNIVGSSLKEIPTKPEDIATNEEARKEWRKNAAKVHATNVPLKSKIIQSSETLAIANKFKNEESVYFQYQLDFRGRVYAVNPFLTPQGTDLAKSLLTFKNGDKIETEEQLNWLKMHGANEFGVDKVSMEERYSWVDNNVDMIKAVANDPLSNREWVEADSPFCFLAFCKEYSKFLDTGFGFISHLPIGIDGSNNGLQILSMLSRDEVTGLSTNCTPCEKPQDIYQDVADQLLSDLAKENTEESKFWLDFGVNRKTCKKAVMTTPYGLTLYSCKDYVMLWFVEELQKRGIELFPKEITHLSQYLGIRVWNALNSKIGKAKNVMKWLQDVAVIYAKEEKPISWITPEGLLVNQQYNKEKLRGANIRLYGKQLYMYYVTEEKEISPSKQKTGISPNFVHSLDGACLQRTVRLASNFGIENFQVIHDSFGTTAGRTMELSACVREAYKQVFEVDILQQFKNSLNRDDLPELPKYGSLDISKITDSTYLFA